MTVGVPGDELVFLPLGGAGEIGMNFNAYGYGPPDKRQWIIVDCGVLFGREGNQPGVDVLMPDIRALTENREEVLGIIATHAHEDHIGAIAHLWPMLRCSVYATAFTARLITGKLEEAGLSAKVRVTVVPVGGSLTLGPFTLDFISITHSILEPNLLAIGTPLGVVAHTGDWKIDPDPLLGEETDAAALEKLGNDGVLALVCDSTNALVSGTSGSESTVRESLADLIGTLKGRVAVTGFASNIARLDSIAHAARMHGRKIALVGRSMQKMVQAARECGYLKDFPPVLDEIEAMELPPRKVLFLCTGSQGEPRAAMARIADDSHPNVHLAEGDTVIFSSRVIPGNELAIFDLQNQLAARGIELVTAEDHFVHVSGHPCRDELAQMYRWIRPRVAIPVHGEVRHQVAHARLAREMQVPQTLIPQNGHLFRLAPGRPQLIDEVPSGRIHLDGRVLVAEGEGLARSRRAMGHAGLLVVSLVLDGKGRVAALPTVLAEGMPQPVAEAVERAVTEAARGGGRRNDPAELAESVRRAARRAAHDAWGKKPVTRVLVTEV
ncbi:MAG: MBL fold metallo-hydrolase [Alphaproteobacteria bacterium 64-11]|nr:ribonuclease J [Alphaproteobacteria bacterium]OJU13460.1 MAG: MBL fold metallo-hydrolase [Alphaproteobacteria bacterium 64-11]